MESRLYLFNKTFIPYRMNTNLEIFATFNTKQEWLLSSYNRFQDLPPSSKIILKYN